jgi:hypothetical protein
MLDRLVTVRTQAGMPWLTERKGAREPRSRPKPTILYSRMKGSGLRGGGRHAARGRCARRRLNQALVLLLRWRGASARTAARARRAAAGDLQDMSGPTIGRVGGKPLTTSGILPLRRQRRATGHRPSPRQRTGGKPAQAAGPSGAGRPRPSLSIVTRFVTQTRIAARAVLPSH